MGLHVMGTPVAQGGETGVKESAKDSAASAKDYLEQKLGRFFTPPGRESVVHMRKGLLKYVQSLLHAVIQDSREVLGLEPGQDKPADPLLGLFADPFGSRTPGSPT